MLTPTNTQFLPPFPDNILVNEGLGAQWKFVIGKTYRIRVINFAAFGSAMLHFDSHTMTVISNDAAYVQKQEAYQLRIAPAQRYDVLISAIDRDNRNFPFLVSLDINRDWTDTSAQLRWGLNYTGYLVLDPSQSMSLLDVVNIWQPFDESHFKALDGAAPFTPAGCCPGSNAAQYDKLIQLDFNFCFDQNGYPRYVSRLGYPGHLLNAQLQCLLQQRDLYQPAGADLAQRR
jgi:iron transport multicopper oxidase